MSGMEAEVAAGFKERGEHIEYQTGKIVLNWARTFQCQPERFYSPKSEDNVVEVFPIIEISCDLSG